MVAAASGSAMLRITVTEERTKRHSARGAGDQEHSVQQENDDKNQSDHPISEVGVDDRKYDLRWKDSGRDESCLPTVCTPQGGIYPARIIATNPENCEVVEQWTQGINRQLRTHRRMTNKPS